MNFYGIDDLGLEDVHFIENLFERKVYPKNQLILSADEAAQAFYCIEGGRVRLFQTVKEQEELISVLGQGQSFGEQTIVSEGSVYPHSVSTLEETTLLVLSRERFDFLMQERLSLGMKLILSLTRRFRETYKLETSQRSKILAFYGPKGGAGCTTMACNFAFCLSELTAKKVMLVDLNLQFGDAVSLCRESCGATLATVFSEEIVDVDLLARVTSPGEGFDLISGPAQPEEARLFNMSRWRTLLGLIVKRYDYVVLDLPSELGELVEASWDYSDFLFVVVAPSLPGLLSLNKTLRLMKRRAYPDEKLKLVLNRFDGQGGLSKEEFLRFLEYEYVVFEENGRDVLQAANRGALFVQDRPQSEISEQMKAFTRQIVTARSPVRRGGIFSTMKRLLLG